MRAAARWLGLQCRELWVARSSAGRIAEVSVVDAGGGEHGAAAMATTFNRRASAEDDDDGGLGLGDQRGNAMLGWSWRGGRPM